ncbi:MAG: hypothetical protein ACHQRM_17235 [Bacteroidia bacterium]
MDHPTPRDSGTYFVYLKLLKSDPDFRNLYYIKDIYPNGHTQIEGWAYSYKYTPNFQGYNPNCQSSDTVEILIGDVWMYYSNGKMKLLEYVRGMEVDSTHIFETWYKKNGKIKFTQIYKKGDQKNRIISCGDYDTGSEGFKEVKMTLYRKGKKHAEGELKEAKKEGVWKYYGGNGKDMKKVTRYRMGKKLPEE